MAKVNPVGLTLMEYKEKASFKTALAIQFGKNVKGFEILGNKFYLPKAERKPKAKLDMESILAMTISQSDEDERMFFLQSRDTITF